MISKLTGFFQTFESFVDSFRSATTYQKEANLAKVYIAQLKESLNKESDDKQHINVMKVIYLHMLGYPVQFAEMSCVKLMSAPRFIEKKVGYLACSMLIDENSDFHQLVVHTINTDMASSDCFVQGMALSAFACIISEKLAASSLNHVLVAISSSHPFVVSKAAICGAKLIEKNPMNCVAFVPAFTEKIKLSDPAIRISFCCLGISIVEHGIEHLGEFWVETSRVLMKILTEKNIGTSKSNLALMSIHSKVIRLLCALQLKKGEQIDGFSEVLINFIGLKLPSEPPAVKLKEASIFAVAVEAIVALIKLGLRESYHLHVVKESLTKMLTFKSKNIYLVALKIYRDFVSFHPDHCDFELLQGFLNGTEIYPVKLALESIFHGLIAIHNCKMVNTLIEYLDAYDLHLKPFVVNSLISTIVSFTDSDQRWKSDSLLRVMSTSGNLFDENLFAKCVAMIMSSDDQHRSYFIHSSFQLALRRSYSNFVIQLTCWLIGEIGYQLMQPCNLLNKPPVDSNIVLQFLHETVVSGTVLPDTKYISLTSLVKILIQNPALAQSVQFILKKYLMHVDLEIQKRSCEYIFLIETMPHQLANIFPGYTPPPILYQDAAIRESYISNSGVNHSNSLDFLSSVSEPLTEKGSSSFMDAVFGQTGSQSDSYTKMNQQTAQINSTSMSRMINVIDNGDLEFGMVPCSHSPDFSRLELYSFIKAKGNTGIFNAVLKIASGKSSSIEIKNVNESEVSTEGYVHVKRLIIQNPNGGQIKLKIVISFENQMGTRQECSEIFKLDPTSLQFS